MAYWLMKSEPDAYGIDDLEAEGTDHWDGIRNYQVRNMIRDDMKEGDVAFFYHSSCPEPGIVGLMTIVSEAYPDFTAFDPDEKYYDPKSDPDDPRWLMVDVRFEQKFPRTIKLAELRSHPELEDMILLRRGNRLSIMPIDESHYRFIMSLV